ncbi:hypothetical protein [Geobacter sp.]|uniref:hypothetical protein n=1 Tax=Geobacter sp. TaxID=46610 RepID=UPI002615E023|nr:hypothetical protein [Geobacter sp.]
MDHRINELIDRIKSLEEELEAEFDKKREELHLIIEEKRIRFAREVVEQQRRFKTGLLRYLVEAQPLAILTAPLIYAGFIPFLLLDLFVTLYQAVCFPVYGIPKVRRRDYLVFDRESLPYLNLIEKFNCFYCSYANGIAAFTREVGARTEQYWCPIKHARRMLAPHRRYSRFFEYGDAESFRKGLERLRKEYRNNGGA